MGTKIHGEDIVRVILLLGLLWITQQIWVGKEPYILHSINLVFHEAGHVFFIFFGDFIHFLGGTLGQLIVPGIVGLHFVLHRNVFGAVVTLWWIGTNFVDIGRYMADARAQILPLIGGEHDWFYLFATLNTLDHDVTIGNTFALVGYITMIVALLWGLMQLEVVRALLREEEK
jgi:hypothetical protein